MTNYKDPFVKDIRPAVDKAVEGLRETVDIAVIGLSGGADSTLCACLAVEALGAENVYGLHLPYNDQDEKTFNSRSQSLAEKLGIYGELLSIYMGVKGVVDQLGNVHMDMSQLNKGNTRSRMRMVMLYAYCCHLAEMNPGKRVRVIGTGNLSEDYIGYDTKWGDGACDIFPISDFLKREVYMALDLFKEQGMISEEHIDRKPSAGLWEGQTDEGELGYSYDEMAPAILFCKEFVEKGIHTDPTTTSDHLMELVEFVWKRHQMNSHKIRPAGIRTIYRDFEKITEPVAPEDSDTEYKRFLDHKMKTNSVPVSLLAKTEVIKERL